jgi:hypothetical protein
MVLPVGLEVIIIKEIKIIRKVNFHGLQILLTMLIIKPVKHSKLTIEQVFQLFQKFFL